jgi:hypothetical protein
MFLLHVELKHYRAAPQQIKRTIPGGNSGVIHALRDRTASMDE